MLGSKIEGASKPKGRDPDMFFYPGMFFWKLDLYGRSKHQTHFKSLIHSATYIR